jgi:toxin ParE1/3/4
MSSRSTEVIWDTEALSDLTRLLEWLATLPNAKPKSVLNKIEAGAQRLARNGDIGRPSKSAGTRELSISSAPYVLIYRCQDTTIEIIGVFHTAQDR